MLSQKLSGPDLGYELEINPELTLA